MWDIDSLEEPACKLFDMARENDVVLALTYFKDGKGCVVVNGTHDELMQAIYTMIDYMRGHLVTSRKY